jgi:peroxiredoxin
MKIKIFTITAIAITTLLATSCHASVSKIAAPVSTNDTTTHAMLHPDANTIYLDTAGNKITAPQFMENMKTGKYTFLPDMKDGKVISIKLKTAEQKVTVSSMAPEFSGTDLNGKVINLKALKGKTVILNFWFTSCAPCLQEIPELNDLVTKYKDDNSVVFVAVTYNSPDDVKKFLKQKDFKFSILAGHADIINQYGISGYPTSMVIDKKGNVVFSLTTYDGTNVQQLDGVIGALKKI